MTIRKKTVLLITLLTIILAVMMIFTAKSFILRGYRDLENEFAHRNLDRAVNILAAAQEKLLASTGDYASWDDSYEFVNHPENQKYRKDNFIASSLSNININAMLFFNNGGTLVAQAFAIDGKSEIDSVPKDLVSSVQAIDGLMPQTETMKGVVGSITVGAKLVMVAARPILSNGSAGPSRGTLVFCKYLDSVEVGSYSSILGLPVAIVAGSSIATSPDSLLLRKFIASGKSWSITAIDRDMLCGFIWMMDITGKNAFILSCHNSRDIYRYGLRAYNYSLAWLIIIAVIFALSMLVLIERSVLLRFIWLRNSIDSIKRKPEPSQRIPISGNDEVTALTNDINTMLTAIEQEQKRAEKSERQYRLLFGQMLNGFAVFEVVHDPQGVIEDFILTEVNPAFERYTGLAQEECIGKRVTVVLPEIGTQWVANLSKVLQLDAPFYFESSSSILGKHFEVLAFKATAKCCGITFTDITNRIKAEEEQVKANENLSQAQKMQAIGQLAGGIAHDFNNQLAGILGYAELLRRSIGNDGRLSKYTDRIIAGIRRAADLTLQLLAFAHKGKHINRPVNIHAVIHEVAALLERTIDRKIKIAYKLRAHTPVTMGDPTQLQNVILNIGLNARDAMSDGGQLLFATEICPVTTPIPRLGVPPLEPGKYLMVSITDTGTGIDDEVRKHLFEPFFTTKPRGKGTGMGLAASYGTVVQHNGTITVASEIGKGTTFSMYLPLSEQMMIDEPATGQFASVAGNPLILVVDDEPVFAELASESLELMGCAVECCSNGREAVALYRKKWDTFDLILLDMVMPEMNGTETFNKLRSINPAAKVIISSGFTINNEVQNLIDHGALTFLQKPYTLDTLREVVSKAVSA